MNKVCFVIMGFGKKTDYNTGKTFNLDQTYKNIIQPAVATAGYECVRADEIQDSGIIDKSMYALLIQAELVIADISTYNPNAIYELGIRHAVKPFSTIILKEREGKIPFDLDHTRIFQYHHQGDDIGVDEASRCQSELVSLIKKVTQHQQIDSPLYEYLNDVIPPKLPEEEYIAIIKDLADKEKHIFAITANALEQMKSNQFIEATNGWKKASKLLPNEPYFIQQQAVCKYKSKSPSENTALVDALNIIRVLQPDETNDPETLGITASIYKRLWLLENDVEYLNRAIDYYGKGFKISENYYTGENYALCLNFKGQIEPDQDEKTYTKVEAKKTRESIISHLERELQDENFKHRVDKKWVLATLSQCYFALGDKSKSDEFEKMFLDENILDWENQTFSEAREQLAKLLASQ